MLKLCFDLAHSMFSDGYRPCTIRHGEENIGYRADDSSFCFVVWSSVILCRCGWVELFCRSCAFWGRGERSPLVGWGWAKAIQRKMWGTCSACTILFLFCKKSWTIFDNKSKWWKMLLSCLVFICFPSFGILFNSSKC